MAKAVRLDATKCTECRTCELKCSFVHLGVFNANKSGVRIVTRWPEAPSARICRQCDEPKCLEACPVDALWRGENGSVVVKYDECIGCAACVDACPYDGVWLDPLSNVAIKCDTCQGRYECIGECFVGALSTGE